MRRAILMTLDGLRRDLISAQATPNLVAFASRAENFVDYRTVFPSCTRVVSASVATGCYPARHELQGNSLALMENGVLVPRDAGDPDFLQHKRRITGRSLAVPTLAERLAGIGGTIVFNNVSPGAAYAHDPDGYGYVYHRAGSFSPGRMPINDGTELRIPPDLDGDRVMTGRFIREVVFERRPPLGVLWLGDPDATQHNFPLGSPQFVEALQQSDARAGEVIAAVDACRTRGEEDILLMIGSDHGHQTVTGVVDIARDLIDAGFKQSGDSRDLVIASNGTSALIYVDAACKDRIPAIHAHLDRAEWADRVVAADALYSIGQAPLQGLTFAVSMLSGHEPNHYGIKGTSLVAKPSAGKADRLGCGQHGGFGAYEQMPFLTIGGAGFVPGAVRRTQTEVIDLAPTILAHLGLATTGMDGKALQAPN